MFYLAVYKNELLLNRVYCCFSKIWRYMRLFYQHRRFCIVVVVHSLLNKTSCLVVPAKVVNYRNSRPEVCNLAKKSLHYICLLVRFAKFLEKLIVHLWTVSPWPWILHLNNFDCEFCILISSIVLISFIHPRDTMGGNSMWQYKKTHNVLTACHFSTKETLHNSESWSQLALDSFEDWNLKLFLVHDSQSYLKIRRGV